jgi:hypothetical protein
MATDPLSQLPTELTTLITDLVDFEDLVSLSAVNSHLRDLLIPSIFNTTRFDNQAQNAETIRHVVTQYGTFAKKLCFELYLSPDERNAVPGPLQLPDICAQLLRGQQMPDISHLVLNFVPKEYEDSGFPAQWPEAHDLGGSYVFDNEREDHWPQGPGWRRTMTQMWRELKRHQGITSLELQHLPALVSAAWEGDGDGERESWAEFLGRLQNLLIRPCDADGDRHVTCEESYGTFLENLNPYFFAHLATLKRLHFIALPKTTVCVGTEQYAGVILQPKDLPSLEEAHFENMLIDSSFADFLVAACSRRLKRLRLTECSCSTNFPGYNADNTWAGIFFPLADNHTMTLQELIVTEECIDLPELYIPSPHLEGAWPTAEHGMIWAAKDSPLRQKTGDEAVGNCDLRDGVEILSRPFAYSSSDDKYGFTSHNEDSNRDKWEEGEDFEAYKRLMTRVRDNAIVAAHEPARSERR